MPVYKFTDGRKGWYFQFYFEGRKIKKERWKNERMESKAEATRCEHECLQMLKEEKNKKSGKLTLYELYDDFVNASKSNLKESTLETAYLKFKRNYLILIKDRNIWELTPNDILNWKNEIAKTDNSINYKNRMLKIMKSCLAYGQLMYDLPGKLQYSLLDNLKENRIIAKPLPKYIPEADFRLLVDQLKDEFEITDDAYYYYTIFNLIYYTGLRIGELAALTIKDYNGNVLSINKDYVRVGSQDIVQAPKNANSIRDVYLDSETVNLLNIYIDKYKPKKYLFNKGGKFVSQQRLRDLLHRLGKEVELDQKYELKLHNLRHSHSSNLRKLGFDEYAISKRLGNTPEISASTYIHSEEHEQIDIAKKIRGSNDLFINN